MAPAVSSNLVVNKKRINGRRTFRVRFSDWPLSSEKESQQTVVDRSLLEQFEEEMQIAEKDDDDCPQTWPVEKIVKKRIQNGCNMFEIKWEGYSETTWEPEENIPETLIKEFENEVAPRTRSVEQIVGQKLANGRNVYEVKWSGCPETTWEPEENICEILERCGERRRTLDFPKMWWIKEIVNERMKNGRKMFEVKWVGCRKTTWEPRENVPTALVQEFEKARRQTRESSKTWSVEKILQEKMENGRKMYEVKWSGSSEYTWEPVENIPEIVIKEFEEKKLVSAKARKTWPIKNILNQRIKKGRILYQVKWAGWKNTTWEPKENIPEILIKEYEQKKRIKLPNGADSENMWPVEKILDQRTKDGRTEFEVKWTGWTRTTWEPEENIPEILVQNFKEKRLTAVKEYVKLEIPSESTEAETTKFNSKNNTSNSDESTSEESSCEDEDNGPVEPRIVRFKKNLTPMEIVGALNEEGELLYLIKWKETAENAFVLAREANERCPQLVIKFLQSKIEWNFTRKA